jgi:long-subunit acyl-CoA synthetase (AMP-forming)
MRRFELEPVLASFEKFNLNEAGFVPPIIIAIIMSPLNRKYSLKSIKYVGCGAAPLSRESQARFKELLAPEAVVLQVWGMTETSCIATQFYHPEDDYTGSVGRPMPGCDVK